MTDLPGTTPLSSRGLSIGIVDKYRDFAASLRYRAWCTSGSRFNAARRLARREMLFSFSIAVLSVIAIVVGLVDVLPKLPGHAEPMVMNATVVTTILSLFVLVISLLEGNSRQIRAHRLHESGVRLSALKDSVELLIARGANDTTQQWPALEGLLKEYETELRECPFNHDPIDNLRFRAEHRKSAEFRDGAGQLKIGPWTDAMIRIGYLMSAAWLSVVSWMVVVGVLALSIRWSVVFSQ